MTKLAAIIRRTMLAILMTLFLIACVTKAESNTFFGLSLYMGMLISAGIYFLFSLASIIVRLIRRIRMSEHDAQVSAYTDTLLIIGNSNTIDYFRKLSFWGTIMLLIHIFVLNVPSRMIVGGPYSSDTFLRGYHGFLLWSLVSLVLLSIISILFFVFYLPHYGEGAYNVFQYFGKLIISDIATPFNVVKDFFFNRGEGKRFIFQLLRLITLIVFIIINIIAVIKTI